MWIMLVITTIYSGGSSYNITSVEISSRERCIKAAEFTKKQPNIANAFCIQK